MQRFNVWKAVFAQIVAAAIAISIEQLSSVLLLNGVIGISNAHLLSALAVVILLVLPTRVVFTKIRNIQVKVAFLSGGLFLVLYHLLLGLPPALGPPLFTGPLISYVGMGLLLVSFYAAMVEIAMANDRLRAEEEKFGKLIQAAQEAVAILDERYCLAFVNSKFIETLGVSERQILGRHLREFVAESQFPECLRNGSRESVGASARFECRLQLPEGGTLHTLASVTTLTDDQKQFRGAFLMLTDMSALKEAESALRERERNYREIFNATNEAMIILDAEGRILDVNSRTCDLFGIGRDEALNSSIDDINNGSPSHTRVEAAEWVRKVIEEGPQLFEWPVHSGDGQVHWTEVGLRASNVGDRPCVIAALRDISERKHLEEQLRQAQKMEAVGQLAGGIAHDFNNLLQVINGYSDFALEESSYDARTREALSEIRRAGHSAAQLVRQLLAFSRRQILQQEVLDLNEVIGGTIAMLHRVIGEHINVKFIPGRNVESVLADRSQLEQVLMNLSVNARDAMHAGGTLTIETGGVILDKEFCHGNSWAKEGQFVLLSISDTGSGMDAQTLSRIWEPFFTTKEVGKGTGLGLPTVYGIVRQHEGMVHVYSEPDKGTVFRVYLPAVKNARKVASSPTATARVGGSETILLAEDNEMVRDLTKRILEQAGYTVITARDGEEALELFEKDGSSVTLALLDLVMPRLGGHAVFENVKERFPNVRFLFASGYSAGAVQAGLVAGGDFELIQKPYKRNDLLARMRQIIDAK